MQVSEKALAQADAKAALRTVMKSWLPLSEAVLGMAVEELPDPVSAAPERLPRLLALDALGAPAALMAPALQQVRGKLPVVDCRPFMHRHAAVCMFHNPDPEVKRMMSEGSLDAVPGQCPRFEGLKHSALAWVAGCFCATPCWSQCGVSGSGTVRSQPCHW